MTGSGTTAAVGETQSAGNNVTLINEVTEFEFTKIWKDISSQTEVWPTGAVITVTFNAYTDSETQTPVFSDQDLTFSQTELPEGWTAEISEDGKRTVFKTSGLPAAKDGLASTYYVVEERVEGYKAPIYADESGNSFIDAGKALNRNQIINIPESGVELPSTGSGGVLAFTIAGAVFAITSGAVLTNRIIRKEEQQP